MNSDQFLKNLLHGTKRLVILGVGSRHKADDAAGVMISEYLWEKFRDYNCRNLKIIIGETAPENYTSEIKKFKPDHLIVIDATDLKGEPGSLMLIDPQTICGVSFSSHMLPLNIMLGYIQKETDCKITILGIQVADVTYGNQVTDAISKAIDEISSMLEKEILKKFVK